MQVTAICMVRRENTQKKLRLWEARSFAKKVFLLRRSTLGWENDIDNDAMKPRDDKEKEGRRERRRTMQGVGAILRIFLPLFPYIEKAGGGGSSLGMERRDARKPLLLLLSRFSPSLPLSFVPRLKYHENSFRKLDFLFSLRRRRLRYRSLQSRSLCRRRG